MADRFKWVHKILFLPLALLTGCWTGPHWPIIVMPARSPLAPSIGITSASSVQRDAFCRIFRESGQFSDVDCSERPRATSTLELRYSTLSFDYHVGQAILYGLMSVFNCTFPAVLEVEQEHRAVLTFRSTSADFVARGRARMSNYICFPGIGLLSPLSTFWVPAIAPNVIPSWERLEQLCTDAPTESMGIAVGGVSVTSTQRNRSACNIKDRFLTESSAKAAVELVPQILQQMDARMRPVVGKAARNRERRR